MTRVKKKRNVRGKALTGALMIHVAAAFGLYFWRVGDPLPQYQATELSVAFPSSIPAFPPLQEDTTVQGQSTNPPTQPEQPAVDQHEVGNAEVSSERLEERDTRVADVRVRKPAHSVLFDIRWKKGGERRKLGGVAPVFPSDLQPGARVQLDLTLQQDGRVKSVRVVKATDERMKEPSVRAVRRWRFDLPKKGASRGDQACLITFRVRAK